MFHGQFQPLIVILVYDHLNALLKALAKEKIRITTNVFTIAVVVDELVSALLTRNSLCSARIFNFQTFRLQT